jgi:lysocardiolipin and lysophospholipid acyltransferase
MTKSELRQRPLSAIETSKSDAATDTDNTDNPGNPALDPNIGHPSGEAKYGRFRSFIRAVTFSLYFGTGILTYALAFQTQHARA